MTIQRKENCNPSRGVRDLLYGVLFFIYEKLPNLPYPIKELDKGYIVIVFRESERKKPPLCTTQSGNDLGHFFVLVDFETLLLGNTGKLNVLRVELLLHDLLESFKDESLSFFERQGLKTPDEVSASVNSSKG